MTSLEVELEELGAWLAHGDGASLPSTVAGCLRGSSRRRSPVRWPRVAVAAVVVVAVVLAVPGTREAIAHFFGVGAVEIRPTATTSPRPGPSGSAVPGAVPTTGSVPSPPVVASTGATATAFDATSALTDAARRVAFRIRVLPAPGGWGPLRSVEVDDRVPGGLVALVYDGFTVVEVASAAEAFPIMAKLAPSGVTVSSAAVNGRFAVWVGGAHEIAYEAPDGSIRQDTVRRAGSVLVWTSGSLTLRVEGFETLAEARAVAEAVG